MESERRYYLAEGRDEEIVREFFERRMAAFDAARKIGEKFGGSTVTQGNRIAGILFEDEVPPGWKSVGWTEDGKSYFLPERRSNAGKDAYQEITSLRIPDAISLHSAFSEDGGVYGDAGPRGGFFISYITAEIVGGRCIIHVPEKMDFHPPHSRLLKQSEYWQIKEEAASRSAAA